MFHDDKQFFFLPVFKCVFNYTHFCIYAIVVVFGSVRGVNSIYSPSHALTHMILSGGEKKARSRTLSVNYVGKFIRLQVR